MEELEVQIGDGKGTWEGEDVAVHSDETEFGPDLNKVAKGLRKLKIACKEQAEVKTRRTGALHQPVETQQEEDLSAQAPVGGEALEWRG